MSPTPSTSQAPIAVSGQCCMDYSKGELASIFFPETKLKIFASHGGRVLFNACDRHVYVFDTFTGASLRLYFSFAQIGADVTFYDMDNFQVEAIYEVSEQTVVVALQIRKMFTGTTAVLVKGTINYVDGKIYVNEKLGHWDDFFVFTTQHLADETLVVVTHSSGGCHKSVLYKDGQITESKIKYLMDPVFQCPRESRIITMIAETVGFSNNKFSVIAYHEDNNAHVYEVQLCEDRFPMYYQGVHADVDIISLGKYKDCLLMRTIYDNTTQAIAYLDLKTLQFHNPHLYFNAHSKFAFDGNTLLAMDQEAKTIKRYRLDVVESLETMAFDVFRREIYSKWQDDMGRTKLEKTLPPSMQKAINSVTTL